jgi:hypothetical protein
MTDMELEAYYAHQGADIPAVPGSPSDIDALIRELSERDPTVEWPPSWDGDDPFEMSDEGEGGVAAYAAAPAPANSTGAASSEWPALDRRLAGIEAAARDTQSQVSALAQGLSALASIEAATRDTQSQVSALAQGLSALTAQVQEMKLAFASVSSQLAALALLLAPVAPLMYPYAGAR